MKKYKTLPEINLTFKESGFTKTKITGSKSAYDVIKEFYFDDINIYESFFILLLNRNNTTIGFAKISQGGQSGTVVDIKTIAKYAIESMAANIILAHNHPSGNTKPSEADIEITKKTNDALNLLDINVLDHLILTSEDYYSFADNGKI